MLATTFAFTIAAANPDSTYTHYDWDTTITLAPLTDREQADNAIILVDTRMTEYVKGDEEGDYSMYITRHKRIRVNNDKGIDEYNKVFVPIREDDEVIMLKARSISKDGTVKVLNEESIKNLDNYEDYGNFALFAIEGVEKGGEIEYVYTIKRSAEIFGRETYQTDVKIKKATFTLIVTEDLKFGTYGYNGFPDGEFVKDGERYVLNITVNDLEALYEEAYSGYEASKQRISYKLTGRKGADGRLNTWNDASMHFLTTIYASETDFNPAKFIKELKLAKYKTDEEKILALENYLKTNISVKLESGEGLGDPAQVVSRLYGNEAGLTRVYAMVLNELGIRHQLVQTCSRYDNKFVAEFEDYYNLDEYMLYLPELKKFISPANIHLRMGVPPSYLAGNKGLFITVPYGFGQVRDIPTMGYKDNTIGLDAEILFDKNLEYVTVKKKQSWTGHTAYTYRFNFAYADDENKEAFIRELLASGLDDAIIKTKSNVNAELEDNATDKPLELSGEFASGALLENAGNSYILNVGDIIGPQAELYQEHERQTDIAFPYPKQYLHHIYFTLPAGYTVKGLDDVKINKKLESNGEVLASFISDYKVEGNVIHINVHEYYVVSELNKELYEGFRSVINAASDFNKVALVLEPISK
jgi:hypothetical protein